MDELEQTAPDGVVNESPANDVRASLAESLAEAEAPAVERPEAGAVEGERPAGDRPRRPDGTFAPKEAAEGADADKAAQKPAGEPETGKAPEAAKTETEAQTAAAAPQTGAVDAPAHWSQADKEKFNALPADGRQHFLDMYKRVEAWYTPKLQKLATIERDFQGVPEMFAGHVDGLKARGQTPADIIKIWGQTELTFMHNKSAVETGQNPGDHAAQRVAQIIAGYKIDPGAVARVLTAIAAGEQPQGGSPPPASPEIAQLRAELQQYGAKARAFEEAAERERLNSAQNQIDTFANEKDGDGNLKNPFFAELEQDIGVQFQLAKAQGQTLPLSELYTRAVWANPTTREKLVSLQKEQDAKRAAAERKAQTERAQKAGVSVSGAPGSATVSNRTVPTSNASVTDDLRASIQQARA